MAFKIFICLLAFLSHGVALFAPFQFDDLHQIVNNPVFLDPSYIPDYFTNPWIGSTLGHNKWYRPLLFMTFLSDGLIGGASPIPYRVTSILLLSVYALISAKFTTELLIRLPFLSPLSRDKINVTPKNNATQNTFFSFLRLQTDKKVEVSVGQIVGILVAVHPLLSETVLLASSRSSSLMAIFALSAFIFLLKNDDAPQLWKIVFFTLCALLTKETAIVLAPLSVFLVLFCSKERLLWKRLFSAWPIVLLVALYILFYKTAVPWMASLVPHMPFPASLKPSVPADVYPAKGAFAFLGFLKLTFFPWGLSPTHYLENPKGLAVAFGFGVWIFCPVIATFLLRARKGAQITGFALLWFYLALFPTLVLVPLNMPMSEHRVVLALIVPFIAIAWMLHHLRDKAKKIFPILVLALIGLSILEGFYWRSPSTLWEHQAKLYPQSSRILSFVASTHFDNNELDLSREAILKALRIEPKNPLFIGLLASIAVEKGENIQAEILANEGLKIENELPTLHIIKAQLQGMKNLLDSALLHINKAIELAPRDSGAWNGRGNILWMRGDLQGAMEAYDNAIKFDPKNEEAMQNMVSVEKLRR